METTLRLCHGTSEARLHRILREGIKPRQGNERGNFDAEIASVEGHTYLTGPYALYYSENASPPLFTKRGRIARRNAKRVVIEVDASQLDPNNLRPDEDALRQYRHAITMLSDEEEMRKVMGPKSLEDERENLEKIVGIIPGGEAFVTTDPEEMRELWPHSYRLIGSVAYKGVIPPEAIVQYAKLDPYYTKLIMTWGISTEINVLRHLLIESRKGLALTNLIFDGTPLEEIVISPEIPNSVRQALQLQFWVCEADRVQAMLEREKGVRICMPVQRAGSLPSLSPSANG